MEWRGRGCFCFSPPGKGLKFLRGFSRGISFPPMCCSCAAAACFLQGVPTQSPSSALRLWFCTNLLTVDILSHLAKGERFADGGGQVEARTGDASGSSAGSGQPGAGIGIQSSLFFFISSW